MSISRDPYDGMEPGEDGSRAKAIACLAGGYCLGMPAAPGIGGTYEAGCTGPATL